MQFFRMHPDTTDNTSNEIVPLPAESSQVPDEIDQIYRTKQLARKLNAHAISLYRYQPRLPGTVSPLTLDSELPEARGRR
jgi:hypothetical protein